MCMIQIKELTKMVRVGATSSGGSHSTDASIIQNAGKRGDVVLLLFVLSAGGHWRLRRGLESLTCRRAC